MAVKGGIGRLIATTLYFLAFCSAVIILGSTGWFIIEYPNPEGTNNNAVVGIAAVTVLYTLVAMVFTCCLIGVRIFAFIAVILDIIFAAMMIAVAVLRKDATEGCGPGGVGQGWMNGWGSGWMNDGRYGGRNWDGSWNGAWNGQGQNGGSNGGPGGPGGRGGPGTLAKRDGPGDDLDMSCNLYIASFAFAIIAVFCFLGTAAISVLFALRSRRELREKTRGATATTTVQQA